MLDLARHAQVQFSLALLALLVCVVALAWRNVFGRPPAPDLESPEWLRWFRANVALVVVALAWHLVIGRFVWLLLLVFVLLDLGALAWRIVSGRPLDIAARLLSASVPQVWRQRGRWLLDLGLAGLALALALFSMTAARVDGSGLDRGRVLHEVVQAKYHQELGWDRLYACTWAADHDGHGVLGGIQKVRVLSLDPAPELEPKFEPELVIQVRGERQRRVPVKGANIKVKRERPPADVGGKLLPSPAAAAAAGCRERFDDQRWAALGVDLAVLGAMGPKDEKGRRESMAAVLEGFGSTATPARLARQRLLFSMAPVSTRSLFVLSLLGGLLAVGALVLVERAFGLRAAALVGIACFVEFAAGPLGTGATIAGALVLAAVLAGFAAAELERWALAGVLLAFAAVELVWPTLVVLALLAKLAVDLVSAGPFKKKLTRSALSRFGVGAVVTAAVLLLFSATLPGGLGNWSVWADRVAVHRYADGSRQIGLRWLFAPDGSWLGGARELAYPSKAQRLVDRHGWTLLCGVLLLVPSLLAVRRLPPLAFAAIAGVTATFAFFSTDASAWGVGLPLLVLAAAAVARRDGSPLFVGRPATLLVAGCLALCVGMQGIVRIQPFAPWLFNMVYSHLLTGLFLGLGVALLVLPGLREHGDLPGAPASIPVLLATSGRKSKPKPKSAGAQPQAEAEVAAEVEDKPGAAPPEPPPDERSTKPADGGES